MMPLMWGIAVALFVLCIFSVAATRRQIVKQLQEGVKWNAIHLDRERLRYLQLAWRAQFARLPDEPDEVFIARFKAEFFTEKVLRSHHDIL
jgi:hypothetical protein